jgi:uncharacterized protein YndB with AHSA1/START domain
MVTIILILVVVVVSAVLLLAASRPNTFRIERSAQINASPDKVFALVNDFKNWTQWSPWEKVDPNLKRDYSGAPQGVGASYHWSGSEKVGEGQMDITESIPPSKVALRLSFIKPFAAVNTTEFTFVPAEGGTRVTWAMFGPSSFMHKIMSLMFSMDSMLGQQFEQGLNNMKAAAEKS